MKGCWTFLFAVLASLWLVVPAAALDRSGVAHVTDGDSLRLGDVSIRLHGIDAPEMRQSCTNENGKKWACGVWSRDELRKIVAGKRVTCTPHELDRFGRQIATCRVGGQDIGALMVERGAAVAYTRFSKDYVPQERLARAAGRGIWAGPFVPPQDWRRSAQSAEVVTPAQSGRCVIKGNISGNGRIYHMPGQQFYDRTKIDTGKGERWFCTEAEARAAGWRKAKR